MDHRITQCPRCGTSFRVTEAHLAVAAGAVRCGSCLHIFNARDHWAEEDPGAAPERETEAEPDDAALDDIVIDDDALFDDNTPLFADDKPALASAQVIPIRNNVVAGNFPRHNRTSETDAPLYNALDGDFAPIEDDEEPEALSTSFNELDSWEQDIGSSFGRVQDLDEELSASDEEWTQDLLRDDAPLFPPAAAPADEIPHFAPSSPAFAIEPRSFSAESSLDPSDDDEDATPADYGLADAEPGDARVEPVFGDIDVLDADAKLFADDEQEFEEDEFAEDDAVDEDSPTEPDDVDEPATMEDDLATGFSALGEPSVDEQPDFAAEFLDMPSGLRPDEAGAVAATAPPAPSGEPETVVTDASYGAELYAGPRGGADDVERDPLASLDRLGAEPLQIHQFKHEPRWPQILWGLALVALLALLGGQYVYANFDALARGPARPWLEKVCDAAGCMLPPQSDISQIRSGNLIVRSHPSRPGALVVDAIITNLAPFPQPYPQLQLQFSDLNGQPVAGRRFQASEYLAGELSGASLMPVQQPVHIALELVDPGPQAVNYSLSVMPVAR